MFKVFIVEARFVCVLYLDLKVLAVIPMFLHWALFSLMDFITSSIAIFKLKIELKKIFNEQMFYKTGNLATASMC